MAFHCEEAQILIRVMDAFIFRNERKNSRYKYSMNSSKRILDFIGFINPRSFNSY